MEEKKGFWVDLRSAIMFITILPAGRGNTFSPTGMIRFFPVVGLMAGVLLALVDTLASQLWPPAVVALVDVLLLVGVTGAFHLDGLGDAADGLFSHRSRERALEIMKDSRTGMMGLVAIFCVLSLKVGGIYAAKTVCTGGVFLVLMIMVPAYARGGMLFGIRYLQYGRQNTGTGHDLFEKRLPLKDFIWMGIPLFFSFFMGVRGLVLNVVFAATVFLLLWFYKKKMGCITGDMLGAMTEITEAVLFLGAGMSIF